MLQHPTLDQLRHLKLHGMARARKALDMLFDERKIKPVNRVARNRPAASTNGFSKSTCLLHRRFFRCTDRASAESLCNHCIGHVSHRFIHANNPNPGPK